jgi:EAL domain-containing protein (putative c-di-GMP-specific phosphodiesterase class I)
MPRVDEKFLDQMDQEFTGWSDPAARLHAALDNDELTLYYQPIRALTGAEGYPLAEVLVRMGKEEKALLPPGEFLPVFEHYGMMGHLDRWVVRTLARRVKELGSKIPRFTINVSGQTLEDPDFPDYVAEQARATGIAPGSMLFEIDEADLLSNPRAAELLGVALKHIGSGTLIDGFGRRAVSFAPLKTMRAEFIKVDGSITRRVLAGGAAETKMKAVVRVGEALSMGVIAECVEEQDVLIRLKALGAGYAQGFGISRPQPIDFIAD